jgi:membrane protease YdiL (CAAX protease family)
MISTTLILSIAAALLALKEAKKTSALANDDSLPAPHLIYTYLPIRIVYIIAYEYFFRGIILFSSLQRMNAFWAILLNTAFYLIAHILGDRKEILGTLLLGPLLCAACMIASSFWPAVVVHLSLTLFYEIGYLRLSYKRINHIS